MSSSWPRRPWWMARCSCGGRIRCTAFQKNTEMRMLEKRMLDVRCWLLVGSAREGFYPLPIFVGAFRQSLFGDGIDSVHIAEKVDHQFAECFHRSSPPSLAWTTGSGIRRPLASDSRVFKISKYLWL